MAQAGEWCAVSPLIHTLGSLFLPWLRRAHSVQFHTLSPDFLSRLQAVHWVCLISKKKMVSLWKFPNSPIDTMHLSWRISFSNIGAAEDTNYWSVQSAFLLWEKNGQYFSVWCYSQKSNSKHFVLMEGTFKVAGFACWECGWKFCSRTRPRLLVHLGQKWQLKAVRQNYGQSHIGLLLPQRRRKC